MSQRFYPSAADITDPVRLEAAIRKLYDSVYQLRDGVLATASEVVLKPADLPAIRDALQSTGSTPINTIGLSGTPKATPKLNAFTDGTPPDGAFASFDHQVKIWDGTGGLPTDVDSAQVDLWWNYTHGAHPASGFAITITDGTATYVDHVNALIGTGALKHNYTIKGAYRTKPLTISIIDEVTVAEGVATGTNQAPADWNAIVMSANAGPSGSVSGATNVGNLDWNGGAVWFGTAQYRNNLAPSNAPTLASIGTTVIGASDRIVTLNTPGYTQGTNIATHIAVLVMFGAGTVSLTRDAIVTLINLASLPANYVIPYVLSTDSAYEVAVAACALTRSGYSFNSTFVQKSAVIVADVTIGPSSAAGNLVLFSGASGNVAITGATGITGTLTITSGDIALDALRTVDGVDVSAHAAATVAHGTTGNILGANMTNTMGASGIIDLVANSAKWKPRKGGDGSADPTNTDIAADEVARWNGLAGWGLWQNEGGTVTKL